MYVHSTLFKNSIVSFQLYILLWAELSNCFLSIFSLFSNAYSISSCDNFCFAAKIEKKSLLMNFEMQNTINGNLKFCPSERILQSGKKFRPEMLKNCHNGPNYVPYACHYNSPLILNRRFSDSEKFLVI